MSTLTTSRPRRRPRFRLQFHPKALEEWRALDGSVQKPLKQLLEKRLQNPHVPGGALTGELQGCYKIKLRKLGVRLVYRVRDDVLIVLVLAVDRRERGQAYRSAVARLAREISTRAPAPPDRRKR